MEYLQIRNIRSLTDTGKIRLAPITLLVGQNSSGKSTFARFLPMLKQGAEARTREPFLWLGRLVDFGSAQEAYSRFSQDQRLGITLEVFVSSYVLDARRRTLASLTQTQGLTTELVTLSIDYCFRGQIDSAPTYEYVLKYRDQDIKININDAGRILSLLINESDYSELAINTALISSWFGPIPSFEILEVESVGSKSIYAELLKLVRMNLDGRTGIDRAQRLARALAVGPISKLYERSLEAPAGDEYWRRQVRLWGPKSKQLRKLGELVTAFQFFSEISSSVALLVRRQLTNIRYITPLRASAERYYRLQGLSVEEIDPQGQNIAMFLHNLSASEKDSFGSWMEKFFGVEVTTQSSQGHVSLFLKDRSTDQPGYNLADTGFGYSQMLPILVQLWSIGTKKRSGVQATTPTIFAIEQPELHLHPKLQAKLSDVFLNAVSAAREIGVDLRLIIETHSEQIVSTLGIRIAQGTASTNDVNVVLFEKRGIEQPTAVRETEFTAKGTLKSWPYGFFEADFQ